MQSLTIPLILFSLANLFALLINHGFNRDMWLTLLVFTILAAIGMAFSKESKSLQRKFNEKVIIILSSELRKVIIVPEFKKKEFVNLIKKQPVLGFNTFIKFLEEEKRLKDVENLI